MTIRMTKNSSEIFRAAKEKGLIQIIRQDDGIKDVWFCIQCTVNVWHHLLCNANGPLIFNNVNDALEFLRKRRVYASDVKLPEA